MAPAADSWIDILDPERLWDSADVEVNGGSGRVTTAYEQVIGGSPYDAVASASDGPTYDSSNSLFGGYPTFGDTSGVHYLQNSDTTTFSQPYTLVFVANTTASGIARIFDRNTAGLNRTYALYYEDWILAVYAGTGSNTSVDTEIDNPHSALLYCSGSNSTYYVIGADGSEWGPTTHDIGTNSYNPVTLLNHYNTGNQLYAEMALFAVVDGALTSGQEDDFFAKLESDMGWTLP